MANIELVIKIPEEIQLALINNIQLSLDQQSICNSYIKHAILTGIALPKGHGRLIDEGMLKNQFPIWIDNFSSYEVNKTISKAPTIIEADKRDEG